MSLSRETFQKELTEIAGRNRFNDPRLILVHGKEARWHPSGPLKYTIERKCRQKQIQMPGGLWVENWEFYDVPLDRYVVEQWVPPEFLLDHNQYRFVKDEKNQLIDEKGPFPARGKWRKLEVIEHPFTGEPMQLERVWLDAFESAWKKTLAKVKHGEMEAATDQEIYKGVEEAYERDEKKYRELSQAFRDMWDDACKTHWHRVSLANHTEGMHGIFHRGTNYDPNAFERIKRENEAAKAAKQESPIVINNG